MSTDEHKVVADTHRLARLRRSAMDHRRHVGAAIEPNSNMVVLSRRVIASQHLGVISEDELKHIVTSRFDYPPLIPDEDVHSSSLVAAFAPYSAKGRAIRYLAARIILESASGQALCFSVAGADRNSGASFIAANLAIAYSEFGLRTLLIDANLKHPYLHQLFDCEPTEGLATLDSHATSSQCYIVPQPLFRGLSFLPAGKSVWRTRRRLSYGTLADRLRLLRPHYDVIICDTPALAKNRDDCEVVAGICGSALTIFRKNHTRLSKARALLASLDDVGTRQIGSVLCDF